MKRELLLAVLTASSAAFATVPRVDQDEVRISEDRMSRVVTVTYTLRDAPAIVTLDIQTNGVSIGMGNFRSVEGAVNRLVTELGVQQTITWKGYEDWPGYKIDNATAVVRAWSVEAPPDYRVIDLLDGSETYYAGADAVPGGVTNDIYKTSFLVMRRIPAAYREFRAGAPSTEYGQFGKEGSTSFDYRDREVPHLVSFTNDYYVGIYPVTQKQYQLVGVDSSTGLSATPSNFKGASYPDCDLRPVEKIAYTHLRGASGTYSWPGNGSAVDPKRFLGRLRTLAHVETFDLPTDAQWEYACRAGCSAAFSSGVELTNAVSDAQLDAFVWNARNSDGQTHPVGMKDPNAWGLYDMHGNVWEWVRDWYSTGSAYSDGSPSVDPPGAPSHASGWRPMRGGAYSSSSRTIRAAYRNYDAQGSTGASYGFRLYCGAKARTE